PSVSHLTIDCPHLLWNLRISPSHTSKRHAIVNDVLVAICYNLRKRISQSEYELLPNGRDRNRAAQAYRDRHRRLRDRRESDAEKSGGMMRIDFFMEKTRFGGLSRGTNAPREEGWKLSVLK
ncbi:hypothetical protein M378DRAFT_89429, partial [Amanita muscaria Koide BX008]